MLPTVPIDSLGGGTVHGGVNGSFVNTPTGPVPLGTSGCQANCVDAQGNPTKAVQGATRLNYFANPGAAFLKFRPTLLPTDTNHWPNTPLRVLASAHLD